MMTSFMPFRRLIAVIMLVAAVITTCVSADFTSMLEGNEEEMPAISAHVRKEPVKAVEAHAKKNAPDERTTPAIAKERISRKYMRVIATGYTAGIESTGKKPGHPLYGITYSGVKVRRSTVSTIAADPKIFPIGTLLYVPGYGYGVVADTGSAIKGRKIDLYFETRKQVYKQWGKRSVEVQIIKQGEGKLSEAWIDELNKVAAAGKSIPESLLKS